MSVTSQSDEHKRQVNLQLRLSFELKAAARDERETLSRLRFTWAAGIAKELKQPLGDVAGAVVDKAVAAPITTRKGQLDEGAPCFLGSRQLCVCSPARRRRRQSHPFCAGIRKVRMGTLRWMQANRCQTRHRPSGSFSIALG